MSNVDPKSPDWYNKKKLRKVYYASGYTGWVIDLKDGTCRFANSPLLGEDGPQWGDRVALIEPEKEGGFPTLGTEIIERYA